MNYSLLSDEMGSQAHSPRGAVVLTRRNVEFSYLARQRRKMIAAESSPENAPCGAECERSELSLGNIPYLDVAITMKNGAMVCEIPKNPFHQYKRAENFVRGVGRGKIREFSSKSRMRLIKKMAEVQKGSPCHFVSLTFPSSIGCQEAKSHLWAFWRRFERTFTGKIGMIWKLEPQKRGVWHFHLMVYGIKFIPHRWAKFAWSQIIGSQGVRGAFDRGVDIKFVPASLRILRSYVAKYFSKDAAEVYETKEDIGRVWGVRGKLPVGEVVKYFMTEKELVWLWRLVSRKNKRNQVKMSPVFFSDSPPEFINRAIAQCLQESEAIHRNR